MPCDRCGQSHPGDSVCEELLEDRYGTLSDSSETMEQIAEGDLDE